MSDFDTTFDGLETGFGAGFGAGLTAGDFDFSDATFTAMNESTAASSTHTISPQELFNDFGGSAPPSAAFTNLTSPDINASPFVAGSTDVSPMFQGTDDLAGDTSSWFPLFPDSTMASTPAPPLERNASSISTAASSSEGSPLVLDEHNFRRKSSHASGASPGGGRHPSLSGVSKPRRRKGPLPPIAVDPADKTALKRARNTLAARESRQRKLDHLGTLELRIKDLERKEALYKAELAARGYVGSLLDD